MCTYTHTRAYVRACVLHVTLLVFHWCPPPLSVTIIITIVPLSVYIHACTYVRVHAPYTYPTHTYITYLGTYTCTYIRTHIHTYVYICIYTYTYTHIGTHLHTYVHIYTHTYTYTHIDTHIHT